MAFGDEDLDSFFLDGDPVTVVATGKIFQAHFDVPEKVETFGQLNVRAADIAGRPQITFTSDAGVAAGLARDVAITVKGRSFVVRSIEQQNDGQISVAQLRVP
jgi:hypothetical protein